MKAVKELGLKRSALFFWYGLFQLIYSLFFLPPIRKSVLSLLGSKIGSASIIMNVKFFNLHHTGFSCLRIGQECFIGDETLIDLYDQVVLQDQVTIAQRVTILTHLNVGYADHPLQSFFPKISKPVIFKKGSVIGANATILPGVTIGERSFVAAGSVVTKSVPARTLVAGVPAKFIRKIQ